MMKHVPKPERKGAILVLVAIMLLLLIVCASFCVDLGVASVAQHQLQTSADSAAIAGATELLNRKVSRESAEAEVYSSAALFAADNQVLGKSLRLAASDNGLSQDVVIGRFATPFTPLNTIRNAPLNEANAVKVHLESSDRINGGLPTFFSRAFGVKSIAARAEATAAFVDNFRGFTATAEHPAMVLPITLSIEAWNSFLKASANFAAHDSFMYDPSVGRVAPGTDGIAEFTIYPQSIASAGNFGTIDIGSDNNGGTTLGRQIRTGLTPQDLAFHGGEFALDSSGQLNVSGDPGLKLGPVDAAMDDIIGQTRILPIFKSVIDNGQRARFTIVAFVGIRIMDSRLTSNDKRITVQPAPVTVRNGISDPNRDGTSTYIFSPIRLVK
jgi:hypothetical protein